MRLLSTVRYAPRLSYASHVLRQRISPYASTPSNRSGRGRLSPLLLSGAVVATSGLGWWYYSRSQADTSPSLAHHASDDKKPPLTSSQIDSLLKANEKTIVLSDAVKNITGISRIDICQVGSNEPCEDRWVVANDIGGGGVLLGVVDGHIGPQCAHLTSTILPQYVSKALETQPTIERALTTAFESLDRDLLNRPATVIPDFVRQTPASMEALPLEEKQQILENIYPAFSGAVASMAFINRAGVWVANLGDSRTVIIGQSGVWDTVDHQADTNEDEVKRLMKEHPGEEDTVVCRRKGEEPLPGKDLPPLRVIAGLMCTRSFGDAHSKWPVDWQAKLRPILNLTPVGKRLDFVCKTPPYISSSPDITRHGKLEPGSAAVICTDGITDNLSTPEIAATITEFDPNGRDANAATYLIRKALGGTDEAVGRKLSFEGRERRKWRDDCTAICVFFD